MAIKRNAPITASQELQVSSQVVYRYKSGPKPAPTTTAAAKTLIDEKPTWLYRDLLRTCLTTLLILAVVGIIMWQGWLTKI